VVVSRADPELVKRLFEQEVPEIYDGTVVIKGCAREAGERTKIAVFSRDRDVDCVGACVGMKGMRVQSIIRELRGEKIDIIEFSEDPVQFATHALSPAKISRVTIIDLAEKHMEVIVDDSQLSLAIGKKGQNVRLAAKLLGWKIDIKSEEEKRQEVESAMAALVVPGDPVSALIDYGLDGELADRLSGAGISTIEQLGSMTPEQLEEIPGFGEELGNVQAAVNNYYGQFESSGEGSAPETAADGEEVAGEGVSGDEEPAGHPVVAEHLKELAPELNGAGEPPAGHPAEKLESNHESPANDSDTMGSSASNEEHVVEEGNSSRQSSEHRSPEE
jgi:N utilization substance protein A